MAGVNVSTDAQREYDKEEGKQKEEEKKDEEEEEYGEEEARDYAPEAPKVCKTCGCRDERPVPDHDSCAGCEAMADLGEAFAFYPAEHPDHRVRFLSWFFVQSCAVTGSVWACPVQSLASRLLAQETGW